MGIPFSKYQGTRNDFVLIDVDDLPQGWLDPARIRRICVRFTGVGADGILVVGKGTHVLGQVPEASLASTSESAGIGEAKEPSVGTQHAAAPTEGGAGELPEESSSVSLESHPEDEAPHMTIYNADGSLANMCGNGIRCVALHLYRRQWSNEAAAAAMSWDIFTEAGSHACTLRPPVHQPSMQEAMDAPSGEARIDAEQASATLSEANAGVSARAPRSPRMAEVSVSMQVPDFLPSHISHYLGEAPMINAALDLGERVVRATLVSMGNPHAVIFDIAPEEQRLLGPRIGADPRFSQGINVGFADCNPETRSISLRVFERGAGWTQACGTGACAAAVAAVETGRIDRGVPIDVHLPGGSLRIEVGAREAPVIMTGPVDHVFDGVLPIDM